MQRLLPVLLAALLLLPGVAKAEERILHFLSDVSVQPDGRLEVTETILVRAEGDSIKHGILRDFPTVYRGRHGTRVQVGFDPIEVRRNGGPEPWTSSALSNGVRLRIGSAETMLPPGDHQYLIRYTTSRQLGFFEDHDELYWNATGTGWQFPIDVAEARVRLPRPATFGERAVYTGPQGASGKAASVVAELPDQIIFRTTSPLAAYEGLTIAVAWPKGIIAPPEPRTRMAWWMEDNGPKFVGLAGLLGILAYYFSAWRRVGRGPRAGTIVPIFAPPGGLSAAAMRYIVNMGSDNRAFAAALVELGVRSRLRLVEGEKRLFSKPKMTIEKREGGSEVAAPEAAMLAELFAGGDSIVMEQKNHAIFSGAQKALATELKKLYEGKLFLRNLSWSLRGFVALLFALSMTGAATVLTSPLVAPGFATIILLGVVGWLAAFMLYWLVTPAGSSMRIMVKALAILIGLAAAGIGLAGIGMSLESGRIIPLLLPLLSFPLVVSAFSWMAAPTREGRAVLDRIAGFRQYLSITEEERLETLHPPAKTPELFERYLPFAIALDVENEWAERFATVLALASAAGQSQTFAWYAGHENPWSDPGDFVDHMGSSLASTVASASAAPGSSGGSGGGGSSGGGGGGGGGGGW